MGKEVSKGGVEVRGSGPPRPLPRKKGGRPGWRLRSNEETEELGGSPKPFPASRVVEGGPMRWTSEKGCNGETDRKG